MTTDEIFSKLKSLVQAYQNTYGNAYYSLVEIRTSLNNFFRLPKELQSSSFSIMFSIKKQKLKLKDNNNKLGIRLYKKYTSSQMDITDILNYLYLLEHAEIIYSRLKKRYDAGRITSNTFTKYGYSPRSTYASKEVVEFILKKLQFITKAKKGLLTMKMGNLILE